MYRIKIAHFLQYCILIYRVASIFSFSAVLYIYISREFVWDIVGSMNPAESGLDGPEDATEAAAGTRPRFGSAMSWSSASSAMSRPRFGSAMSWTEGASADDMAAAAADKSQHGDDAPCDALVNRILSACRPAFAAPDASSQEQADAVSRLVEVRKPPKP